MLTRACNHNNNTRDDPDRIPSQYFLVMEEIAPPAKEQQQPGAAPITTATTSTEAAPSQLHHQLPSDTSLPEEIHDGNGTMMQNPVNKRVHKLFLIGEDAGKEGTSHSSTVTIGRDKT